MTYLEFLEKVVNELSKVVKGSAKLEFSVNSFGQPDLEAAYFKVTFNRANISAYFDCGINSEAKDYYSLLCNHPKHAKTYIECCAERLQTCLEHEILYAFFTREE